MIKKLYRDNRFNGKNIQSFVFKQKEGRIKSMNHKEIGNLGEALAAELLKRKGYQILERNYRCAYGEIDIIAARHNMIAFVEVKTRLTDICGDGRCAVDSKKRHRIHNAAGYYLSHTTTVFDDVDFQVAEVALTHITDLRF